MRASLWKDSPMKNLKKPEVNYWKNAVIGLLLIMSGMWAGTAQTGKALKELKVSVSQTSTTQPSAEGKAK